MFFWNYLVLAEDSTLDIDFHIQVSIFNFMFTVTNVWVVQEEQLRADEHTQEHPMLGCMANQLLLQLWRSDGHRCSRFIPQLINSISNYAIHIQSFKAVTQTKQYKFKWFDSNSVFNAIIQA